MKAFSLPFQFPVLLIVLLLGLSIVLAGCIIQPVKPWERDVLAQESMRPDAHPLVKMADEKVYFSKEGSSGGQGVGGGGCGCN